MIVTINNKFIDNDYFLFNNNNNNNKKLNYL